VLDGDPVGTQPPQQPLPTFRPMSIVAKRSPISATAGLLLNYCGYCDYRQITCIFDLELCVLVMCSSCVVLSVVA